MKLDYLRGVRKVIAHANVGAACPDGTAAALVIKDAMPDVEVVFCPYGPKHRELVPEPGVLFVDFSPYAEREKDPPHALTPLGREQVDAWVRAGALVLDHHDGTDDVVARFGDRGVFGDTSAGVSGAVLAYEEVWRPICQELDYHPLNDVVREFARLAGVRDTWQKKSGTWRSGCEQAAGLCFFPWKRLRSHFGLRQADDRLCHWNALNHALGEVGGVLIEQQRAADAITVAGAHKFSVSDRDGRAWSVACFEGLRGVSDCAELTDTDVTVAWSYFVRSGEQLLKCSVRSRSLAGAPAFNCAALAQRYGGNGHPGAAGFYASAPAMSPYAWVELALWNHLSGK